VRKITQWVIVATLMATCIAGLAACSVDTTETSSNELTARGFKDVTVTQTGGVFDRATATLGVCRLEFKVFHTDYNNTVVWVVDKDNSLSGLKVNMTWLTKNPTGTEKGASYDLTPCLLDTPKTPTTSDDG